MYSGFVNKKILLVLKSEQALWRKNPETRPDLPGFTGVLDTFNPSGYSSSTFLLPAVAGEWENHFGTLVCSAPRPFVIRHHHCSVAYVFVEPETATGAVLGASQDPFTHPRNSDWVDGAAPHSWKT